MNDFVAGPDVTKLVVTRQRKTSLDIAIATIQFLPFSTAWNLTRTVVEARTKEEVNDTIRWTIYANDS